MVQCFALYPEIAFLAAHAAAVLQLPGKAHNQLEGLASDDKNASKMHSAIDSVYLNLYYHDPPSKPEPSNFVEALGGLVGAAATLGGLGSSEMCSGRDWHLGRQSGTRACPDRRARTWGTEGSKRNTSTKISRPAEHGTHKWHLEIAFRPRSVHDLAVSRCNNTAIGLHMSGTPHHSLGMAKEQDHRSFPRLNPVFPAEPTKAMPTYSNVLAGEYWDKTLHPTA